MAHHISAIIGKAPIDKEKAAIYDLPVFEENGYVIVGLDNYHSDYWDKELGFHDNKCNEIILDSKCTHFFANEIGLIKYAIIETYYFGGIGEQKAVVYNNAEMIYPTTLGGINHALKMLGVRKKLFRDRFDSINLGKYRDLDDYFEKYHDCFDAL